MPSISIILPVYNVEPYVAQCLESILTQSFQDIEIICVNDASTDNSLSICERYAAADKRVGVIDLPYNEGSGQARNAGMKKASGRYFAFCDADDMYPERALETLHNHITASAASVCVGNIAFMDMKLECFTNIYPPAAAMQIFTTGVKDVFTYPPLWVPFYHPRYLISADFLHSYGAQYPSFLRGQDPPFLAEVLCQAKQVMVCPDIVYLYRTGQMGNKLASLVIVKDFMMHIKATYDIFMRYGAQKQALLYLLIMAQTRLAFQNLRRETPTVRNEYIRFFVEMLTPLNEVLFAEKYAPYMIEIELIRDALHNLSHRHGYHYFFKTKTLRKLKRIFGWQHGK